MADKVLRQMARELDEMEKSVTSEEADLLDRVLKSLGDGKKVPRAEAEEVRKMYDRYLAPRDPDEPEQGSEEEAFSSEEELE